MSSPIYYTILKAEIKWLSMVLFHHANKLFLIHSKYTYVHVTELHKDFDHSNKQNCVIRFIVSLTSFIWSS